MSINPGPVKLTPWELNEVSHSKLIRVVNLMKLYEKLWKHLKNSRVIYIFKKSNAKDTTGFWSHIFDDEQNF